MGLWCREIFAVHARRPFIDTGRDVLNARRPLNDEGILYTVRWGGCLCLGISCIVRCRGCRGRGI